MEEENTSVASTVKEKKFHFYKGAWNSSHVAESAFLGRTQSSPRVLAL